MSTEPRRKHKKIAKSNYFSAWLKKRLYENKMSVNGLADILHVDRRTIYYHIKGEAKPNFPRVVAYCWAFGMYDEPQEIYKLVEVDYL